jgi:hypothetical protein
MIRTASGALKDSSIVNLQAGDTYLRNTSITFIGAV